MGLDMDKLLLDRSKEYMKRIKAVFGLLAIAASSLSIYAQPYSDDYSKLRWSAGVFHRIGNIGQLETVINLRGFVPVLGKCPINPDGSSAGEYLFKVPTRQGIGVIYYGPDLPQPTFFGPNGTGAVNASNHLWTVQIAMTDWKKMEPVKIIPEREVEGEFKKWAECAYDISGQGEGLYRMKSA